MPARRKLSNRGLAAECKVNKTTEINARNFVHATGCACSTFMGNAAGANGESSCIDSLPSPKPRFQKAGCALCDRTGLLGRVALRGTSFTLALRPEEALAAESWRNAAEWLGRMQFSFVPDLKTQQCMETLNEIFSGSQAPRQALQQSHQ